MATELSEGNMEKQDFQKEIDTMDKILEIFDCRQLDDVSMSDVKYQQSYDSEL